MKSDNKKTGKLGEDLASSFLEKKGYRIVERNFSTRFGEIDIICYDGKILVFVEVKTKIGHDFGEPEEMVNKGKLSQIKRMGEVYIEMKTASKELICIDSGSGPGMTRWSGICRVDVVGIVLTQDGAVERLHHFEAVY